MAKKKYLVWVLVLLLLIIGLLLVLFEPLDHSPYLVFRYSEKLYYEQEMKGGKLVFQDNLPLLRLWGPPEVTGEARGGLQTKAIQKLVNEWLPEVVGGPEALSPLRASAKLFAENLSKGEWEEVNAIAEIAGVAADDLWLLNCLPDLGIPISGAMLVIGAGATAKNEPLLGTVIEGRSLSPAKPLMLSRIVRPTDKRAYFAVGLPGMTGVFAGVNEEGLALALIPAKVTDRYQKGYPVTLMVKKLLEEAGTVDAAKEILTKYSLASSASIAMADNRGRITVGEATPKFIRYRYAEMHRLWAVDHFVARSWGDTPKDPRYIKLGEAVKAMKLQVAPEGLGKALASVSDSKAALFEMTINPVTMRVEATPIGLSTQDAPSMSFQLGLLLD